MVGKKSRRLKATKDERRGGGEERKCFWGSAAAKIALRAIVN